MTSLYAPPKKDESPYATRKRLKARLQQLETERSSWDPHWRDISDFLLPRSGRFFVQDINRGERRDNNIYDDTGTRALRTLASGLMAGATSPARPWFTLTLPDLDLARRHPVKVWLTQVTEIIHRVLQKSNAYRVLHQVYEEMAAFGTAAVLVLPDFDNVVHLYPMTVGQFYLAQDFKGRVNTMYRKFQMTVMQMVNEFGLERCSTAVQNAYRQENFESYYTIVHAIEPRETRDPDKLDSVNKKWRSCYFEEASGEDKTLRESGFDRFPVIAPRWATAGGDVYGYCPGMDSLGAVKQLQHQQLRKANAIDFQTEPPLQVPSVLKNREIDRLPGGITYFDAPSAQQTIRSMFDVNLNLSHLGEDMAEVRQRINRCFYVDLFLMLEGLSDTTERTAAEIAARHEEKLTMIGPVVNRLNDEALRPLVEYIYEELSSAGALPEAPPEMEGMELIVEFVSVLAQAQRATQTAGIDRLVGMVGTIGQWDRRYLGKLDGDALIDVYGDALGVNPKLVRPTEDLAAERQALAQAESAKEQALMMEQQASTAKDLAAAKLNERNGLTDVMSLFSGYEQPPPYSR